MSHEAAVFIPSCTSIRSGKDGLQKVVDHNLYSGNGNPFPDKGNQSNSDSHIFHTPPAKVVGIARSENGNFTVTDVEGGIQYKVE